MRPTIRFIRKGRLVELLDVAPTTLLLDYLRETEGATGTKEGCGEGDCGACTVVLGRMRDGKLVYEPVNACIQLLGQVDGAEVVTVEDLVASDGTLHPVQPAMVENHGSQCGFCTPGFVMALFAMYQSTDGPVTARPGQRLDRRQSLPLHRLSADRRRRRSRPAPARARDRFRTGADDMAGVLTLPRRRRGRLRRRRRRASSPRRPSLDEPRRPLRAASGRRPSSPARPMSACGSPSSFATSPKIIHVGRVAGFDQIEDTGHELVIGAGATYAQAEPHLCSDRSRPRRTAAPARLQAGARQRHGRRQHRQRLADRRHAAGADRARRDASSCARAGRCAPCRSRTSSSTTASRTARRANWSPAITRPAPARPSTSSAATRSPSASTRTSRR